MRKTIILLFAVGLFAEITFAQPTVPLSDSKLVEKVIENWNEGWLKKDALLAARDYSDDADWTNAFGMKKKGRAEIGQFLTEVFSLGFVMAGQSKIVEQSVKLVKPDVAVVVTKVERAGQLTPSGGALGTRQTSHLRVLLRIAGEWKIISHLISDARDPERREH